VAPFILDTVYISVLSIWNTIGGQR